MDYDPASSCWYEPFDLNNLYILAQDGLTPSEVELLDCNLAMLTYHDSYDKLLGHHLRQLLADELPSFQTEVECQHKIEGKKLWILINAAIVRNATETVKEFYQSFWYNYCTI